MTSDIAELQTNCNDTKLLDRITDHWDHLVNEAVAQSPYWLRYCAPSVYVHFRSEYDEKNITFISHE